MPRTLHSLTRGKMKTKYKYIHFKNIGYVLLEKNKLAKDKPIWECRNNETNTALGITSYYGPWKQYVFEAEFLTVIFSADCLDNISDFIKQLNKEPKQKENN